jgi:hypothetical protein
MVTSVPYQLLSSEAAGESDEDGSRDVAGQVRRGRRNSQSSG